MLEAEAVISGAAETNPPSCGVNPCIALVKCPALALINPEPREVACTHALSLQMRKLGVLKVKGPRPVVSQEAAETRLKP